MSNTTINEARVKTVADQAAARAAEEERERQRLAAHRKRADDGRIAATKAAEVAVIPPCEEELRWQALADRINRADPGHVNSAAALMYGNCLMMLRGFQSLRLVLEPHQAQKAATLAARPVRRVLAERFSNADTDVMYVAKGMGVSIVVGSEVISFPFPLSFVSPEDDERLRAEVEAHPRLVRIAGDARWDGREVMLAGDVSLPEQWLSYVADARVLAKWAIEAEGGRIPPTGSHPVSNACLSAAQRMGQLVSGLDFWRELARAKLTPAPEPETAPESTAADADGGAA
jgi:hypothetical protein